MFNWATVPNNALPKAAIPVRRRNTEKERVMRSLFENMQAALLVAMGLLAASALMLMR